MATTPDDHDTAFRVLMLAQRFEATAVGGGYTGDQFALRLSFRVAADPLAMLDGDDARHLGREARRRRPRRRVPVRVRARISSAVTGAAMTTSTSTASSASDPSCSYEVEARWTDEDGDEDGDEDEGAAGVRVPV